MVQLLIYEGPAAPDAPGTRWGGVPLTPVAFEWPRCRECAGPMQFLAQIGLPGGGELLSIFMCQNDPGMCEAWDPAAGGNRAYVFGADAVHVPARPDDGITLLDETCAVRVDEDGTEDYAQARALWPERTGRNARDILGQLGGRPDWLQADETPMCGECDRPMAFAVQLEEGHDHRTAMNFGGGCAYGFRCGPCGTAAFLWQC